MQGATAVGLFFRIASFYALAHEPSGSTMLEVLLHIRLILCFLWTALIGGKGGRYRRDSTGGDNVVLLKGHQTIAGLRWLSALEEIRTDNPS